jgi:hypothetical protein
MTDFHKRKTLLSQKRLQRFFSCYSIFAGQWLFSLNLRDLPRRGGDYPYSRIAHIVQQRVKLPPLGILPSGLLQKELVYFFLDMSTYFYQLAKIIRFIFKKQLRVIRLDVYNYTDRGPLMEDTINGGEHIGTDSDM